ncbi:MAG: hypothetical protein V3T80_08420 [Kiloniellales bacterium]|jgi:hypothetical protein
MTAVLEGRRYWKHGDHVNVWVVDAVVHGEKGRPPFAVLVTEDGGAAEDVDLSHLENPELYTALPGTPEHGNPPRARTGT